MAQIIDGACDFNNISAEDIGEYNIAMFGYGDFVMAVGKELQYELVSNNEIQIKDGVFVTQGRRGVIKKGSVDKCLIENGTQNQNRHDLIVMEYAKDEATSFESHTVKVIRGTAAETATDPEIITGDIANGDLIHQMPLYRVKLEGLNIVSVEKLFTVSGILSLSDEDVTEIYEELYAGGE